MGTEPAAGSGGSDGRNAGAGASGGGGAGLGAFFTTLPGLLTAGAGFVVAITGLVTVLNQAGLIGGPRADPAPAPAPAPAIANEIGNAGAAPTPAPSPVSSPAPSPVPSPGPTDAAPAGTDLRLFEVGRVSDNFAWVRKAPSADGETLAKLPTGTRLLCGPVVEDLAQGSARFWRLCPQQGGYVAARLLEEAR